MKKFALFVFAAVFGFAALGYDNLDWGVPGSCDQLVDREGYALGFLNEAKLPRWVSYRLTAAEVTNVVVKARTNDFREDMEIKAGSATLQDYRGSGYDRGHLAPAADMKWSAKAMSESFLMSNMAPQTPALNRGSWAKLEEWVRNAAVKEESIMVVTGPFLKLNPAPGEVLKTTGNGVIVPEGFFKVILDETPPRKMIAFLMDNGTEPASLEGSVFPIQEMELLTGLRFFSALPDEEEAKLKDSYSLEDWE